MGGFSTFPTYCSFVARGALGGRLLWEAPARRPPSPRLLGLPPCTRRWGRPAAPASCGVEVLARVGEEAAPSLPDPGPRFSPIYKARPIARPHLVLCFVLHQAQELLFACLDFGTLQLLGLEIVRLRRERFTVDLYTAAIDESPCF